MAMAGDKFDFIAEALADEAYSRPRLNDVIYRYFPAYNEASCNWVIGQLANRNLISPLGNGYYVKGKPKWSYSCEKPYRTLLSKLMAEFPRTGIAAIGTEVLNKLSMMDGGYDNFIIEVDKRDIFPCYMKIRELSKKDILLTPTENELNYYLKPGAIILKPLFSKSPCQDDGLFSVEKLIVDLQCDRLVRTLYPHVSFNDSLLEIIETNSVNLITCLNYAKRRKCYDTVKELLIEGTPSSYWKYLEANNND